MIVYALVFTVGIIAGWVSLVAWVELTTPDHLLDADLPDLGPRGINCPDCDGQAYSLELLAAFGIKEKLGIRCVGCDRRIAKVTVENAQLDVHEELAEVADR